MSNGAVVTSQPLLTAPPNVVNLENPSAPIPENVVLTQPMLNNENIEEMLAQAEDEGAAKERRRQRLDFCCYVCADSYTHSDDSFCWYLFCRMLCNGCGNCCEGIANCTDSCCEGCASCCHNCCDGQEPCCGDGCCEGHSGGGGDTGGCCDGGDGGGGGCCDGGSGDAGIGDCDCDCNCFD